MDAPVYVLGAAQDEGSIGAPWPKEREARFIVSHLSEEALGASFGKNTLVMDLIALGCSCSGPSSSPWALRRR